MDPLVLAGIVLVVAIATVLMTRADIKRTRALEQFAGSTGFAFLPAAPKEVETAAGVFKLMNIGGSRRFKNCLRKEKDGLIISQFDYSYSVQSSKGSYDQTATLFEATRMSLPAFALSPEGILQKVGQLIGQTDIDFESSPVFSKMYLLRAADEQRVRMLFTAPVITFLEKHPGYSIEGSAGSLLLFKSKHKIKAAKLAQETNERIEMFELFASSSRA